jgi:CubicO group peptidase (beta-lactamase class C family)
MVATSCSRKAAVTAEEQSASVPGSAIHGYVAPGFESVREVFAENFRLRNELGAAVCVYHKGVKVIDLWGGVRDAETGAPWNENTLVTVFSTTKGICALAMALAVSRGYFQYDDKVSLYWPAFAQLGKENITIRQVLEHSSGLVLPPRPISLKLYQYPDSVAHILEKMKPRWKPGTRQGYELATFGPLVSEIIRRTDPRHRTISNFVKEEICRPLAAKFYIGLPDHVPDSAIARVKAINPKEKVSSLMRLEALFTEKLLRRKALMLRAMRNMPGFNPNERQSWQADFPSVNGISNARNLALIYAEFAAGGHKLGLKQEVLTALTQPAGSRLGGSTDQVMGTRGWYRLGFMKPGDSLYYGRDQVPFGWPGAGGSFAFADPGHQLSYAYVMNYLGVELPLDGRDKALHREVYRCIEKLYN